MSLCVEWEHGKMEAIRQISEVGRYWEHLLWAHTLSTLDTQLLSVIWPCLVWRGKLAVRRFRMSRDDVSSPHNQRQANGKITPMTSHLSLSATKMTRRSSSSEANTHTTCLTLRQLKRLSKSTCSNLESIGLLNSITWENNVLKHSVNTGTHKPYLWDLKILTPRRCWGLQRDWSEGVD